MAMARPKLRRNVDMNPPFTTFTSGQPRPVGDDVVLNVEEFEAMRLKHCPLPDINTVNLKDTEQINQKFLTQLEAAAEMGISQSTFSRILEQAHRKVTEALLHGYSIHIEGGRYGVKQIYHSYGCLDCLTEWPVPNDIAIARNHVPPCPSCGSRKTYLISRYKWVTKQ
jgi:predicted DNA-binding protein (UPF0251 family)